MARLVVLWRECPRQKIKMNPAYQPPEPYESEAEVDLPEFVRGTDVAEMLIQANVEADPESWDAFDYVIEILAPQRIAGRYAVEVLMDPRCEAHELTDDNEVRKAA
jgi:hypothetical protein